MISEQEYLRIKEWITGDYHNINKLLSNELYLEKEDYNYIVFRILTNLRWVCKYANMNLIEDEDLIKSIVKETPDIIRYLKQTEELCLLAMESTEYKPWQLFRYSIKPESQTEKICLYAVSRQGMVLNKVVNQTDEICLAAVKQSGLALRYVKNKTEEICIAAINQNPEAIKHIENVTPNIYIGCAANKVKELHKYIENDDQLVKLEETIARMILAMKK